MRVFAILSGYAITGEQWSEQENESADQALQQEIAQLANIIFTVILG